MRSVNPDIVIPANYYNEYALLLRAMKQQKVQPKAIYSVLGGRRRATSSSRNIPTWPTASSTATTGSTPDARVAPLKARVEQKGAYFSYEVFMTYTSMFLLADALERAKSADRAAIIEALAASAFSDHLMPYGPTRFVDGQNTGARPLLTQVLGGDIQVIIPPEYRQADAQFPVKA